MEAFLVANLIHGSPKLFAFCKTISTVCRSINVVCIFILTDVSENDLLLFARKLFLLLLKWSARREA